MEPKLERSVELNFTSTEQRVSSLTVPGPIAGTWDPEMNDSVLHGFFLSEG